MTFLLALFIAAVDQYTKNVAVKKRKTFLINRGIMFGKFAGNNIAITFYMFGLLIVGYLLNSSAPNDVVFALYLGALLSNALDYVYRDGVVDWLSIGGKKLNLADLIILITVLIWIFSSLKNALL